MFMPFTGQMLCDFPRFSIDGPVYLLFYSNDFQWCTFLLRDRTLASLAAVLDKTKAWEPEFSFGNRNEIQNSKIMCQKLNIGGQIFFFKETLRITDSKQSYSTQSCKVTWKRRPPICQTQIDISVCVVGYILHLC